MNPDDLEDKIEEKMRAHVARAKPALDEFGMLQAELNLITPPSENAPAPNIIATPITDPAPQQPQPKGFGGQFKDPDANDPDIIFEEPKLTRWDKENRKWRDLVAKRDALPADAPTRTIRTLDYLIKDARARVQAAESDISRRRENIDANRAGAGREKYNEKRRNGKGTPHADLSGLTEAEKIMRKKDMAYQDMCRSRLKKKGWTEAQIKAELIVRMDARLAKREADLAQQAEEAAMQADPNFGVF